MHRLTQLSGEERRRLIDEFVDSTFGGTSSGTFDGTFDGTEGADRADPAVVAMLRAALPDLPDDPSGEQVTAWVELAELVGDEDFRARMRRTAAHHAGRQPLAVETAAGTELMEFTRHRVAEAREAGVDPLSNRAAPVIDDLVRRFADALARTPDAAFRNWLAEQFEEAADPRVDRYWQLVWIINGWQVVPGLVPAYPWIVQALRADREA